ncbi:MAG: hypothetical protein ACE37D_19315 [Pseudomonadales bacterium]
MPHSISQHLDLSLILAQLSGSLDEAALLAYFKDLEAEAPYPENINLLLVFDQDAEMVLPTDSVRTLARRQETFHKDALRVVVAPGQLAYGLSRVYASTAQNVGKQYRVCQNLAEAAVELGLDEAQLKRAISKQS